MAQATRGTLIEQLIADPGVYPEEGDYLVLLAIALDWEASKNLDSHAIVDVICKLPEQGSYRR